MIAYFLLGIALLVGGLLLIRWFVQADPKTVLRALRWTSAIIAVVLVLGLLWGGMRHLLFFAIPFLLPLLLRSRWILDRLKAARGPSPGQASTIETRFLRMTLDHDTGSMTGMVREGPFRGRSLDELREEELLDLWRDCRAEDEQSASVLEAYLDRQHGDQWREGAGAGPRDDGSHGSDGSARGQRASANKGHMTREEAYEILGLEPGASNDEIRAAHRRLMQQMHPDHGGSNYLAAKINQAKELLIGR